MNVVAVLVLHAALFPAQKKPVPPPPAPPVATAAKVEPAAGPKPIDAVTAKAMRDELEQLNMDQVSVQNERDKVMQADPIAKQAVSVLNDRMNSNEEVKKATDKANGDRQALLTRIAALRKQEKLDDTYDWDFQRGEFVKSAARPQPAK